MNSLPDANELSKHLNNQSPMISHYSQNPYIRVISDSNNQYNSIPLRQMGSDNIGDNQGLKNSNLQYLSPIASTERIGNRVYE